ncbi:MAG: hypothetical protein NTU53_07880 [Planctomycetota bacterium]|nr:hypothetical protein [Planctomycetota bacterium]
MRCFKKVVPFSTAVIGMVFWAGWSGLSPAHADTYSANVAPTLGAMTSETVATTPATRTRTTVGLAEPVVCTIDSSTWADKDCNDTLNTIVDDSIGTRQWSASGAGTVSPTTAGTNDSATMTAHKSPGSVTVTVTVKDSETKYNETLTKTKTFTVIAPTGESATVSSNSPYGAAGTNTIGACTVFLVTMNPTTVNFSYGTYRENIAAQAYTWPDGTNETFPATVLPIPVNTSNQFNDTFGSGTAPIGRLWQSGAYVGYTHTVSVPREYENQAGTWVNYTTITWKAVYAASNQKATMSFNTASGSAQGPYN